MTQPCSEKSTLSGIGKFSTLAELLKRNMKFHITFGSSNAIDKITTKNLNHMKIQVIYPDGTEKSIKVKTSRSTRFVTNYSQSYPDPNQEHPNYWVIVYIDKNNISHHHILTHAELGAIQKRINEEARSKTNHSQALHPDDYSQKVIRRGVDNVLLKYIAEFENRWDKIVECK